MSDRKATFKVRQPSRKTSVIDIMGELTASAEDALMDAYADANRGNPQVIVLNFDGLEYMNSSGIGLLVTLLIRANRQGQRIRAVGLSQHYRDIFSLTRLDEAIQIYDAEAQAVAAV